MIDTTQQQLDAAFRLKRAIVALSDTLPSHAKCIVDQFLRYVSPTMARFGGAEFPYTRRLHATNLEACREGGGVYPLLYFHVGHAVCGYYDLVQNREAKTLDARIKLIEEIAIRGLNQFAKHGDDAGGYRLIPIDEFRKLETAAAAKEAEKYAYAEEQNVRDQATKK